MTDKPDEVAELVERLRIMAKQKLFAEMDLDAQESANWQCGYEHFVNEARELFPEVEALSRRNAELEAALREIAHLSNGEPFYGIRAIDIARAALGGPTDA